MADVLRAEYPLGVDLIYESVGGALFSTAVNALAVKGRLVIIGMMASYQDGWEKSMYPGLSEKLLWKSASLNGEERRGAHFCQGRGPNPLSAHPLLVPAGFFLLHYAQHFSRHLKKLVALVDAGKLRVSVDSRRFVGLEAVPDAIDRLLGGQSVGKVTVQIPRDLPPTAAVGAALARL